MQNQADNTDLPRVQPQQQQVPPADLPLPAGFSTPQSSTPVVSGVPQEAADSDLIEKEWVIKAKQIVEHTSDDPYLQQAQLNRIKADYMKKRYNKDIKLPEE